MENAYVREQIETPVFANNRDKKTIPCLAPLLTMYTKEGILSPAFNPQLTNLNFPVSIRSRLSRNFTVINPRGLSLVRGIRAAQLSTPSTDRSFGINRGFRKVSTVWSVDAIDQRAPTKDGKKGERKIWCLFSSIASIARVLEE